jgi:hypothetical protein
MDSRKIGMPFLMGTMALCLVAVTQCQRSGDVRRPRAYISGSANRGSKVGIKNEHR